MGAEDDLCHFKVACDLIHVRNKIKFQYASFKGNKESLWWQQRWLLSVAKICCYYLQYLQLAIAVVSHIPGVEILSPASKEKKEEKTLSNPVTGPCKFGRLVQIQLESPLLPVVKPKLRYEVGDWNFQNNIHVYFYVYMLLMLTFSYLMFRNDQCLKIFLLKSFAY